MRAYICVLVPILFFSAACGEMSDGSAVSGKMMDFTAGVYPRANCGDDVWEPNDDYLNATYLTLVEREALSICGNHDYFLMDLKAGETLEVSLHFYHQYGDLDLAIESRDGTWLASGVSTDDDESASYTATEDMEVLVFVHGYAYAENVYRLSHRLIKSAADCPEDWFEPNDSRDQAARVTFNTFNGVVVCPGNDDWFAFDLGLGDHLGVGLVSPQGKAEVEFFGPGEYTAWPTERSENRYGDINYKLQAKAPGRYLMHVWVHGRQAEFSLLPGVENPARSIVWLNPLCGDIFEGTRRLEGVGARTYLIEVTECSYSWARMYLHARFTQPAGVDYHLTISDYLNNRLASPEDDWVSGQRVETATVSFGGGLGTNSQKFYLRIRHVGQEEGADLAQPWTLELRGGSEGW